MFRRLFAVSRVTFLESIRSKCLYTVFIVILVQLITLKLFEDHGAETTVKSLQSVTYYGINIFILMAGLILAGSQLPQDIANRHLFFVLVKPIRKSEFLLGKIFGIWATLLCLYLLTMVSLVLLVFFVSSEDNSKIVKGRSKSKDMSMGVKYQRVGERLKLDVNPHLTRRQYRLPRDMLNVKTLVWQAPAINKKKAHRDYYYALTKDDQTIKIALSLTEEEGHEGHAHAHKNSSVLEAKWINNRTQVEVALPQEFASSGVSLWPLGQRSTLPTQPLFVLEKNEGKMRWQGELVDNDFIEQGVRLAIDTRGSFPNSKYTIKATVGDETKELSITERKISYLEFFPKQLGHHPVFELELIDSNKATLFLSAKKIWLEGKSYGVLANMWRGLAVTLLNIFIVTGITLIVSAFLSTPTAMLVGFTVFLFAHSTEALNELPKTLLQNSVKTERHKGHSHTTYDYDHDSTEAMALVKTIGFLKICFPTFDRFSLTSYVSRGEYVPMYIFWREFKSVCIYMMGWLAFGAMVVSRKEFLK